MRGAATTVVLLAGPPWLLWTGFGNPLALASSWWSTTAWSSGSAAGQRTGLAIVLIWAGWLAWLLLSTLLAGSLFTVVRGRRLPRWRLPMPLHRLVVGLTGSAAMVVATPAGAALASPPAATAPTLGANSGTEPVVQPAAAAEQPPARPHAATSGGQITVLVGRARFEHRVRTGDTLSKVAKVWLGDANRWPEICRLNKHRHVASGATLTDCDLIYPGWHLHLPADAVPPPGTQPATRSPHRPPAPPRPATTETAPPSATPTPAPPAAVPRATTTPAGTSSSAPADSEIPQEAAPGRTGSDLELPGGTIIPWALAVAISAAAARVWIQRRRRYSPGSADDLHELPDAVRAAQHHTGNAPPSAAEPPTVEASAPSPQLPSGGIGLVGPGADAAARGLIITALTAGTPTSPADRSEVIIDRRTLTALVGDTPIAGWPRLHVTESLDQALTLLDTHLLLRARILDEHSLTDLDTLRTSAPDEQALPPLLLITSSEQATGSNRARITFGLTHDLDVTTIVLGHWPHGGIVSVTDGGDARDHRGTSQRLAVLDITTTRDLLTTVREAQTGELAPAATVTAAPPLTSTGSRPRPDAGPPPTPTISDERADAAATAGDAARARLRVLGPPRIEDITADGRPLRAKALELAVFLAVHPDGATTHDIGEYLEPDARISQAVQRVHTNASNLRHVLGRAGTAQPRNAYVIKSDGRYRLDPATVEVDVWTLRTLLRDAAIATAARRRDLLTTACRLCTAPLADGKDYEWIQPHREAVRRWGTEAHLLLADDLLDDDPQTASDLLDKAIGLDHYNEALYRKAMQARHALHDPNGIRTLLHALTKNLADLDVEPQEDTIELAHRLRQNTADS